MRLEDTQSSREIRQAGDRKPLIGTDPGGSKYLDFEKSEQHVSEPQQENKVFKDSEEVSLSMSDLSLNTSLMKAPFEIYAEMDKVDSRSPSNKLQK